MLRRRRRFFATFAPVQLFLQLDSAKQMVPILRQSPNLYEHWMLIVFILLLALLGYMRMSYSRRLYRLFSSLVRLQILRQVMREELVFSHRVSVLLFVNFALVSALILYGASKFYGWNLLSLTGWELYLTLFGLITAAYLIKLIIGYILRNLYGDSGLIKEYSFEVVLVDKALGIILLPFAIAIIFLNVRTLEWLFPTAAIVALLFLIFRMIQGLVMSLNYPVSRVYIILYLCTLEILPFLVVLKIFANQIV